jgi:hypothetical protein
MKDDGHSDEARPPVVTVSCPSCGGAVEDTELGERTKCRFCGTELYLPTLRFERDEQPDQSKEMDDDTETQPEAAAEPPPYIPVRRSSQPEIVLLVVAVTALVFVLYVAMTWAGSPSPVPNATPPSRHADPKTDGIMANANCLTGCLDPCQQITNPDQMVACFQKCQDKCKFVGKPTGSVCRSQCADTCKAAPDEASRAACASGCLSACPP